MFGTLDISQLLVTTTTISFLSNAFVIAELFCGTGLQQYSSKFEYRQTFITHQIPKGVDKCLIKIFDGINTYTRQIIIK